MARVVFVNRYFYPDISATSQILTDLTFHLASQGFDVAVVTARQRYTDARASLPSRENVSGVDVHRIATTEFGRGRLLGRAFDYVSFYVSSFAYLLGFLRKGDVVVAKTDPPLMSVVTAVVVRLRRARQINWLQDLFPEVATVLEPQLVRGLIARVAKRARDWSLRRAQLNVVLGELMFERVRALGVPRERVTTIQNWTNDGAVTPVKHADNPMRAEWGLEGKFVVGYSGNLGRAHDFLTLMRAALLLRDRHDIVFLIIGAGAQLRNVRNFAAGFKLANVIDRPYQPRERLRLSLGVPDLHVVTLKPALEGLIVPSKFYGIAAAQRPTAFIGHTRGEIARLLERHDCGRAFAVADEQGLADFICTLADDRDECERLGRNARAALEAEWAQAKAFGAWRQALEQVRVAA